jgi:hypothetical protein
LDNQSITRTIEALAARLGAGGDSPTIARSVATTWQEIDHLLSPVIGAAGVAALCRRSVYLGARDHPFLSSHAGQVGDCDPRTLESTLAGQAPEDAAAAGAAVLVHFNDLLAKLVGPALTERLLRPAWTLLPDRLPNQDASP